MRSVLLLQAAIVIAAATDRHLDVYHVNPYHEGVIPLNMDTADLRGDIFFDLRSRSQPVECATDSATFASDCSNEEVVDADLVVSKLGLTVKGPFGEYGRCNVCNTTTDIDPFSNLTCNGQSYLCTCGDYQQAEDCNDQLAVGAENITEQFGKFNDYICTWENWIKYPWICWGWTVVNKTAGPGANMWYSTTAAGWCGADGAGADNCTWVADVVKIVNKSCSDELVNRAVEEYDAAHEGRFAKCSNSVPGARRNISDPCWIYSFYATVLGPDALMPGGKIAGMPVGILDAAFEQPFKDVSEGGCPALPIPPTSRAKAAYPGLPAGGSRRGTRHHSFGVPRRAGAFVEAAQLALRANA